MAVYNLESVGLGVIVHHLYIADTQGVINICYILLYAIGGLLQLAHTVLLAVERVNHLGYIVAGHIDALERAVLVAYGVDG